jgi:hypothetical protein
MTTSAKPPNSDAAKPDQTRAPSLPTKPRIISKQVFTDFASL